jgi:hypothetical protein
MLGLEPAVRSAVHQGPVWAGNSAFAQSPATEVVFLGSTNLAKHDLIGWVG